MSWTNRVWEQEGSCIEEEYGTNVVRATLAPAWSDGEFLLPLPPLHERLCTVKISLFDRRALDRASGGRNSLAYTGDGTLLGSVTFDGAALAPEALPSQKTAFILPQGVKATPDNHQGGDAAQPGVHGVLNLRLCVQQRRPRDHWSRGLQQRTLARAERVLSKFLRTSLGRKFHRAELRRVRQQRRERAAARKAMASGEQRRLDSVAEVFESFDLECNAQLNIVEFARFAEDQRLPFSKAELEDVMSMMDSDGSGDVSLDEFCAWFMFEAPVIEQRAVQHRLESGAGQRLGHMSLRSATHRAELSRVLRVLLKVICDDGTSDEALLEQLKVAISDWLEHETEKNMAKSR